MHSDNHSHIILASIESMVDAARKTDVSVYSITEHISQFDFMRRRVKFSSVHESGRMFTSFDEYLGEFSKIKGDVADKVKVRRGLEVDYIEAYRSTIRDELSKKDWDFLLCSVHELKGGVDVENPTLLQDATSSRKRWEEYVTIQKAAIESGEAFIPFNVLTHPVRLATSTPKVPENFDDLLVDLARVARSRGKALELNGNDLARTPALVRRVAAACEEAGCKVSYGSDSHYPNQVSRNYKPALELVREFNLELI